jgi:hypothetical protein
LAFTDPESLYGTRVKNCQSSHRIWGAENGPPKLRAAALVTLLIEVPAESGDDLAHKASVLLDWVKPCDLPNHLTVSLCRDTIRVHHQHDTDAPIVSYFS